MKNKKGYTWSITDLVFPLLIYLLFFFTLIYIIDSGDNKIEAKIEGKSIEDKESNFMMAYLSTPVGSGMNIADLIVSADKEENQKLLLNLTDEILYNYLYGKKACFEISFKDSFGIIKNQCERPVFLDEPLLDEEIALALPQGSDRKITEMHVVVKGYEAGYDE